MQNIPITHFTKNACPEVQMAARNLRFKHGISVNVKPDSDIPDEYIQLAGIDAISGVKITTTASNGSDEARKQARFVRFNMFL
jgi:hypothetical protein